MPTLYRMQPPGSTNLLTYSVRSFYGVNSLAASPADYDGINEACDWTRRVETAATAEHTSSGVHKTRCVPTVVVALDYDYDAGTYAAAALCYNQGTTGAAVVSSVTKIATGAAQVVLASALPTSNVSLFGLLGNGIYNGLGEITSTTTFKVVQFQAAYARDYWYSFVPTDGPMYFAIMSQV